MSQNDDEAMETTTNVREHDPLCPMFVREDDERDDAYCCLDCDGYGCECWTIRRVRADERRRAVQRIEEFIPGWVDNGGQPFLAGLHVAMTAAARGES